MNYGRKPGFSIHYQHVWMERALTTEWAKGVPKPPLWLRLAWLAYGRHERNGHANFHQGELVQIFGVQAPAVSRAIRDAKRAGFIDPASNVRCLQVSGHAITGGTRGNPKKVCPIHGA